DTSVTFTGLGNGVTQSYQVVGVNPNPAGEGPRSAVVTATTVHCSQNCPTGCCNGETCSSVPTWGNGCKINGQACGPACPAGTDTCLGATCVCHDYGRICDPVIGQADYPRNCGTFNNACGTTTNCGTCPANYVCTAGPGP